MHFRPDGINICDGYDNPLAVHPNRLTIHSTADLKAVLRDSLGSNAFLQLRRHELEANEQGDSGTEVQKTSPEGVYPAMMFEPVTTKVNVDE